MDETTRKSSGSPLGDPVLAVGDARAHLHEIVTACRDEGREFLIGPRRRPAARIVPFSHDHSGGTALALAGDALAAALALAGDSLGFALAQSYADTGSLTVPAAAAPFLSALDRAGRTALAGHVLDAFHSAGGDPAVTLGDVTAALT